MYKLSFFIFYFTFISTTSFAKNNIEKYTRGMQKHSGFYDFFWDKNKGRILLRIKQLEQDFLYTHALKSGVGSNDIGLDRGQLGNEKLVKFKRFGNKILLLQPNIYYRSTSKNKMEKIAVDESFAQSVLWGGEVIASHNNAVLVDISDFLLSDQQGVSAQLNKLKQGSYIIDKSRSIIFMQNTKNFPDNTDFEALITFKGSKPGQLISSVTPSADSLTIKLHTSFVRLPDKPYKVRKFNTRAGTMFTTYNDYSAPLGEPIQKKLIIRHRLEKKTPELSVSDPIKPIIYYLDSGTPEPVRSALLKGARWWDEAFKSAGFSNAFQVKILPNDVDPLDIRYNVIQWVHRSTRGWSYGSTIIDPRSGEILKGHVTLGSLRVRQDMLIAQGLLSPYKDNNQLAPVIENMALLRLQQLAAHEVGHTLGLMHNFNASSQGRSSVMDYPHPLISLDANENISLTDAYTHEIGEWDKISLAYLYSEFKQNETEQLEKIIDNSIEKGYSYIGDNDARGVGSSHPTAHLWDNNSDPIIGLKNINTIRNKALKGFGLNTIKQGKELFKLEQIFIPMYLLHRYQLTATSKLIGGVSYKYSIKGDRDYRLKTIDGKTQARALDALLQTLSADFLAVPKNILPLLLPPPEGSYRNREHLERRTGVNFDALATAQTAAQITLNYLLNSQRAARLIEQKSLSKSKSFIGLDLLISKLLEATWGKSWNDAYFAEVQRSINWAVLHQLMSLSKNKSSSPQVKAICIAQLLKLKSSFAYTNEKDQYAKLTNQHATRLIDYFMLHNKIPENEMLLIPPGSPI